jgi:methylmalonyl-CoA mutase, N-terminal domain
MVQAVKENFPQREIADAAFELQTEIDRGERVVVGVNRYRNDDAELPILRIDPALERKQIDRVQAVRAKRESERVEAALGELKTAAADEGANLMPHLLDCARVHATEGEIVEALQQVFGSYTEVPVF